MKEKQNKFRGCLLGLAVGDAMGYTVDSKTLSQIYEDYGPNGLLGYDLANGCAEITSYTQLSAYCANALLLMLTHRQMRGSCAPTLRYFSLALREWARTQQYSDPEQNRCWLSTVPEMKRKRCMDTWMLSTLSGETLGSLETPANLSNHPAPLTTVIPLALLWENLEGTDEAQNRLACETVALTHGNPETFLSGAVLCHVLRKLLSEETVEISALVHDALHALQLQFGREYAQTVKFYELFQHAFTLAQRDDISAQDAMEQLGCRTAPEVLSGVLYACLTCHGDFDTAMITAVNHSGRSAAVGAITGAILGAVLGETALPEFYLESLEPTPYLRELANDMAHGCPMGAGSNLFDDDWDRKYLHAGH